MFRDRRDAGIRLAKMLKHYKGQKDVIVLALPRGGVVTGFEISSSLKVPLDVIIVRKIGFPGQPELAIGAVSETGALVLNESIISSYRVSEDYIRKEVSRQKEEISRRVKLYRKGRKISGLKGKTIILVDDGIATGATMKSAIETLKKEDIKRLVVALPVSPPSTADDLKGMADEFICIETPWNFTAVGGSYEDFTQVSDDDVVEILQRSKIEKEAAKVYEKVIEIPLKSTTLEGIIAVPEGAESLVIFAHGSGSSRLSPRNKYVADVLNKEGIGTLLFDLLTKKEDTVYETRFDIELLANRLKETTKWIMGRPESKGFAMGYFGASTGAAAAIKAAADIGPEIKAIVSRGGRPDLAGDALGRLRSAILLIIGGFDDMVIELNRKAYELIRCEKDMKIVPGATHLFEEPGKLEEVARLAADWFEKRLYRAS